MVFGPGPHQSLVRSLGTGLGTGPWYGSWYGLGTTKAMYQDFTKTSHKTFTSVKSWYGSYARGGFTRKSLMRVLCRFVLDIFL